MARNSLKGVTIAYSWLTGLRRWLLIIDAIGSSNLMF